jgi:hypothetical protein
MRAPRALWLTGMGVAVLVFAIWRRPGRARHIIGELTPQAVLERLHTLPIYYWSYRTRLDVRHIGPMAQDFYARFGVGDNPRFIYTVDALGVLYAAIQALAEQLDAQVRRIDRLGTCSHAGAASGTGGMGEQVPTV